MKNRTLILQFNFIAGSSIPHCAEDLCEAADRFGVAVEANFNGTSMTAWPGDDPQQVAREFESMRDALRRIAAPEKPPKRKKPTRKPPTAH